MYLLFLIASPGRLRNTQDSEQQPSTTAKKGDKRRKGRNKFNTELGNELRQIKTFYFKSVDPDSKTQSCRSVILNSCTKTAEQNGLRTRCSQLTEINFIDVKRVLRAN